MNPSDLQLVPESLLKKCHNLNALKAHRAAALIANPRVSRKRISDKSKTVRIIKPETLLVQSRARKNAAVRYNRVNKKGMQKRASKLAVVKNKYWDGEREEEIDEVDVLKQKELEQKEDDEDTTEKADSKVQQISIGSITIFCLPSAVGRFVLLKRSPSNVGACH